MSTDPKKHYVIEVNVKSVEPGGDTRNQAGPGRGITQTKVDRVIDEVFRVVMKADDLEEAKVKAIKAIDIA